MKHSCSSYRLFWKMFPRPIPPRPRPLAATAENTENMLEPAEPNSREVTPIITEPRVMSLIHTECGHVPEHDLQHQHDVVIM